MKTEIPQWILDCIDNRNPGRCAEAVEELLAIIEFLRSGKPDWKDAPDWAEWLTRDETMTWRWHENEPHIETWDSPVDFWHSLGRKEIVPGQYLDSIKIKRPTNEKE